MEWKHCTRSLINHLSVQTEHCLTTKITKCVPFPPPFSDCSFFPIYNLSFEMLVLSLILKLLRNLQWLHNSVQLLSRVRLFATPWTAACQASLSTTNSRSLTKRMAIESVMPSNHLILCHPLLLLPTIFPSISVFSNESTLWIRWPKYWSFSFNISPSSEHPGLISFRMDWLGALGLRRRPLARSCAGPGAQTAACGAQGAGAFISSPRVRRS